MRLSEDILGMNLESILLKGKGTLVQQWFQMIAETYPPETAQLLAREKSQFANPVGHTLRHATREIFDELLGGNDPGKMAPLLDNIIRIRAIQDFIPSQAVAFIFLLKRIAREAVRKEGRENPVSPEEILAFDAKVDGLALLAFDIYMQCREKLSEVRINEVKNRTYRLLQRANLIAELPERKPDPNQ